ncbi:hypothetical protein BCV72DRAFT_15124 [Rhizopus microsporus var. microsporus]|uniref:Uncharacterized protein n=2 Tax=Rhizopus microsporus TaxID=58291 RepID=A0A2G4SN82_RHIZD|nr:uncharacterized protein RHIMIDRAFT_35864 [Rhizopus microsporus ATCC 52813]ORE10548.1 hypothetical protein BCV72DRAFT_15124 [Rhizopus microsporus var. microsporus]PHZ10220.1 hypothetical protein RHIMIDRAFT_35864 [Rhizopus microsporus ATCC 52813]
MGFIEKIKNNIDYYKLDKYTKRRVSQSQFESHDRRYYENVYRDGDYIDPSQAQYSGPTRSHLSYKQSRWSFHEMLKKPVNKSATRHIRTSETYTFGRA